MTEEARQLGDKISKAMKMPKHMRMFDTIAQTMVDYSKGDNDGSATFQHWRDEPEEDTYDNPLSAHLRGEE